MKKHQQRPTPSLRARLGQRALPLASVSGTALLISLGLLQSAAAQSFTAALAPQTNTGSIFGTILDPEARQFSTPVVDGASASVTDNTAISEALGNESLPKSGFSLEINGLAVIDLAQATLTQTNSGKIESRLFGTAEIKMVGGVPSGVSNAQATVTGNTFEADASANKAITSIAIAPGGALTLGEGVQLSATQSNANAPVIATNDIWSNVWLKEATHQNNHITVSGNAARTQAVDNDASNSLAISEATGVHAAGTLVLENTQSVSGTVYAFPGAPDVTANTRHYVSATGESSSANTSGNTITVSGNQSSATAQRNLATNGIAIAQGSISTDSGVDLFKLSNKQLDESIGSSVTAETNANTDIRFEGPATDLQAIVSGNRTSAAAGVNSAANSVVLGSASSTPALSDIAGALQNTQTGASQVKADIRVAGAIDSQTLTGALSVTGNSAVSTAFGNQASNAFEALPHSAEGVNVTLTNDQTYAGGTSVTSVTTVKDEVFGISAGNVPAQLAPTERPTTLTVSNNTLQSLATVNQASNLSSLASTTALSSGTLAVRSTQDASASATASTRLTSVGVSSQADLIGTDATVSGNLASAQAMQNRASNALVIDATAIAGAAASAAQVSEEETNADYGVHNTQRSSATTTAEVLIEPDGAIGIRASGALPSTLTVRNNVLSAVARANVASNQLQANSTTAARNASFGVGNMQTSTGNASATIGSVSVGVANTLHSGTPAPLVAVSGNQLEAAASGNAALNALSVQAGTALKADASLPVISAAPLGATAGYVALNSQSNAGAITAIINPSTIGLQATDAVASQAVSVTGNSLNATAYGNHAVNSVALSALPGQLGASAALVSSQVNTGNVMASVSTSLIGSNVTGTNGTTTVARNQVGATAVGNMAIGSMVIGSK